MGEILRLIFPIGASFREVVKRRLTHATALEG